MRQAWNPRCRRSEHAGRPWRRTSRGARSLPRPRASGTPRTCRQLWQRSSEGGAPARWRLSEKSRPRRQHSSRMPSDGQPILRPLWPRRGGGRPMKSRTSAGARQARRQRPQNGRETCTRCWRPRRSEGRRPRRSSAGTGRNPRPPLLDGEPCRTCKQPWRKSRESGRRSNTTSRPRSWPRGRMQMSAPLTWMPRWPTKRCARRMSSATSSSGKNSWLPTLHSVRQTCKKPWLRRRSAGRKPNRVFKSGQQNWRKRASGDLPSWRPPWRMSGSEGRPPRRTSGPQSSCCRPRPSEEEVSCSRCWRRRGSARRSRREISA
mmetsp:Transcript_160806/g.511577  ORF Transcript_160806/g.511577 Transcript_160806/m.511577 type:complete len:319 (-) Transcript_160806:271-1227(-)